MTVLFIVVPLAILASMCAVLGFVWSVGSGQLDDLATPAMRMLEDERREGVPKPEARSPRGE